MNIVGFLVVSSLVFCIGLIGIFLNRKNLLIVLMCLELILLSVNTNFIAFSNFYNEISGQIFVFFILTVAASEVAIGLAIILLLFKRIGSVNMSDISLSEKNSEQRLSLQAEGNTKNKV